MSDEDLDRLLGQLPFSDAEDAPADADLRAWRDADPEGDTEIGESLTGSATARALLESADETVDEFTVERLRRQSFPARRRLLLPAGIGVALAAAALVFLFRPTPGPEYNPPEWAGTTADVRSGDEGEPDRLVYPATGKVRMTLRPKVAQAEAPPLGVYAVDGDRLVRVVASVEAVEDGVYVVEFEVSALPGEGARTVRVWTIVGTDAERQAGQSPGHVEAQPGWFAAELEIEGNR